MMNVSPVFLMKFKNTVERILHVPGNYNGGILEMAVVLDYNLSRETLQDLILQLFRSLKMHSEVFRNVRLNMVHWESDDVICNQVTPMSVAGLTSYYADYESRPKSKDFLKLVQYLKVFQARSKLLILVTDGENEVGSAESLKAAMQPFLDKKLMQVVVKSWNEESQDIQVYWR